MLSAHSTIPTFNSAQLDISALHKPTSGRDDRQCVGQHARIHPVGIIGRHDPQEVVIFNLNWEPRVRSQPREEPVAERGVANTARQPHLTLKFNKCDQLYGLRVHGILDAILFIYFHWHTTMTYEYACIGCWRLTLRLRNTTTHLLNEPLNQIQ